MITLAQAVRQYKIPKKLLQQILNAGTISDKQEWYYTGEHSTRWKNHYYIFDKTIVKGIALRGIKLHFEDIKGRRFFDEDDMATVIRLRDDILAPPKPPRPPQTHSIFDELRKKAKEAQQR